MAEKTANTVTIQKGLLHSPTAVVAALGNCH
jgi:hypothetical protein